MSTANMAIDPSKARAISDYLAANPDAGNRDAAAALGIHESAVRRAKAARGVMHGCLIETIRLDGGTQFRESINDGVASEYAEAYKAGEKLPAPVVFEDDDGNRWLGDGFTRIRAARLAGWDCIECELRKGSLEDAILYAAGANERHGQRRTKADRHRAIETAIKLRPELSNREIANICHVSHELVRQVRSRVDPKFELKPDPLPPEPADEPAEVPHKPAKNQSVLPIGDGMDETPAEVYERQPYKTRGAIVERVAARLADIGEFPPNGVVDDDDLDPDEVEHAVHSAVGIVPLSEDDRKEWDPPIEVEETSPDGGSIDEFASWLAGLPLNGKLQGSPLTQFNADARLYWEFTKNPAFSAFGDHVAKFLKSKTGGLVRQAVERFKNNLTHPRDWKLCSACSGSGTDIAYDRVGCQSCYKRGYHA